MKIKYLIPAIIIFSAIMLNACKKVDNSYVNFKPVAGNFSGNTLAYLQSYPPGIYDSLLLALHRISRLEDTLSNEEITLFAVSNRSFSLALNNINQARRDSVPVMPQLSMSTLDSTVLDSFLCRYILQDKIVSADIKDLEDGLFYPTVSYTGRSGIDTSYNMQMQFSRSNASGYVGGGPATIIFSDPKGSIFYRYWVRVNTITVDIKTKNGIVHLLPPGHDFGFGDEFIRAINDR